HGLSGRAQRAAEIVNERVWLGMVGGNHPYVLDNGRVARDRTLDHVGEDPRNIMIEHEITDLGQGLGKELVYIAHGNSGWSDKGDHSNRSAGGWLVPDSAECCLHQAAGRTTVCAENRGNPT